MRLEVKRVLILYYTEKGSTKMMAELIGERAERSEVKVDIKRVEECRIEELVEADAIVIGSPTYFSNVV